MLTLILSVILNLTADFTQIKSVAMMREPQVSQGKMVYRAPDYLKWEYTSPNAVVWEMNGQESNVSPQIQNLLRMIMASISGAEESDDKLRRESKKLFRSVNVIMDEQRKVAQRVELIDKNGDTTIIEFSNVVTR
ncbi:MAG: outer membrane lipoprotein carrier protein LolA [Paludibacteraceae bacterium]|nr:outer membrane lipoprotein carrier protein LolA [Paludibacteraceae bacterium]